MSSTQMKLILSLCSILISMFVRLIVNDRKRNIFKHFNEYKLTFLKRRDNNNKKKQEERKQNA